MAIVKPTKGFCLKLSQIYICTYPYTHARTHALTHAHTHAHTHTHRKPRVPLISHLLLYKYKLISDYLIVLISYGFLATTKPKVLHWLLLEIISVHKLDCVCVCVCLWVRACVCACVCPPSRLPKLMWNDPELRRTFIQFY